PRSTVATVTEIYDYLRLLFARIGVPHCPVCGETVSKRTAEDIVNEVMNFPKGLKLMILAPIVKSKKGEFAHIPEKYTRLGFMRARVDGITYTLEEFPQLDKNIKHDIEIVVDRVAISMESSNRISQSIEQALTMTDGLVEILDVDNDKNFVFSQRRACINHPNEEIPELEPRLFSFNAPQGACPVCTGLGNRLEIDPSLVFNANLTISEGAIRPFNRVNSEAWYMKKLAALAEAHNFSLRVPVRQLSADIINKILYGTEDQKYNVELSNGKFYETTYEGVIPNLERRHKETDSDFIRKDIERFMREHECYVCKGARLKPVVLAVTIHGLNIMDICNLDVDNALDMFINNLKLNKQEQLIGEQIIKEIIARLEFMQRVGLNYLELGRAANTLSGGEAQRIRLATQIGSGLQGVLYVLDEPSIGLHQRDNHHLIETLKRLRDLGNTVIVVEHDEDTIRHADYLLDIGPGAGVAGGEVVAFGTPEDISKNPNRLTGQYLAGIKKIDIPKKRRPQIKDKAIQVIGAIENNLKNIDVIFPLGLITVVSGVS
ncbi:MAG: excinuclease ABC subunit UvrA, partial [Azovibrio sp.]